MIRMIVNTLLLLLVGAFLSASAAPDAIGIATARGGLLMDRSPVQGNTTLFDGGVLETNAYPSVVRLQSGSEVRLGSTSRGRIYRDRLVLEKGEGQMDKASNFRFEALGLRILPDSSATKARVSLRGNQRVAVSALAGTLRVTTAEGTLVARLEPGSALEFEPQVAGAAAPFRSQRLSRCRRRPVRSEGRDGQRESRSAGDGYGAICGSAGRDHRRGTQGRATR